MFSVSGKSQSVSERTDTDQTKNKIPYSRGSLEVPMNSLGNWLMTVCASIFITIFYYNLKLRIIKNYTTKCHTVSTYSLSKNWHLMK